MSEEDKHSQSTGEGQGVLQYIVHQKQYGGFYIQPGLGVQSTGPGEHGEPHEKFTGVRLDRQPNFCAFLWSLGNLAAAQEH